jgi:hypothetical protein
MKTHLTAALVREHLSYCAETGEIRWKTDSWKRRLGKLATLPASHGYLQVRVLTHTVGAHRAAWMLHTGEMPDGQIDHINMIKTDNRIRNLRCVSKSVNAQNQKVARSKSSTGFLGVHARKSGNCFQASIKTAGVYKYLGSFPTAELAHEAYVTAKRQLHEGCTI